MREAGMKVDACAKRFGGTQKMILSANEPILPLQYDSTAHKMYVQCRVPTQEDLRSIPVHWINDNKIMRRIHDNKHHVDLQTLDNGASSAYKNTIKTKRNTTYLLVPSHSHQRNAAV